MSCEALLGTITQRQIIWMKLSWMFQRQLFLSPTMNEVHNSRLTMSCLIVKYSFIQFIGFWLLVLITFFERIKKQTNLCKKIVGLSKNLFTYIMPSNLSIFSWAPYRRIHMFFFAFKNIFPWYYFSSECLQPATKMTHNNIFVCVVQALRHNLFNPT